jgi:hypothetical protein
LGWLYWTEEQLLTADMNAIMVGYKGNQEMLGAIHGKPQSTEEHESAEPAPQSGPPARRQPAPTEVPVVLAPVQKLQPLTPSAFDKMFGDKRKEMH